MSYLNFIKDYDLFSAVDNLLLKAHEVQGASLKKFNKNVIDPFSPLFETSGFNLNYDEWKKSELHRQSQKSVSNSIGLFHQTVLGSVNGWNDLGTGGQVDLLNEERQIIAEIKNKYNTVKGSDLKNVYHELDDLISRKASNYKGYTAYYVTIIPSRPVKVDVPFTPSDKERGSPCPLNNYIRKIDGASFYELVTRQVDALSELFSILPKVIELRTNELGLPFKKFSSEDLTIMGENFKLAYESKGKVS